MGAYKKAELFYIKSVEIFRVSLGSQHPDYLVGLHQLMWLYMSTGTYEKAEPLLKECMEINLEALGGGSKVNRSFDLLGALLGGDMEAPLAGASLPTVLLHCTSHELPHVGK